MFFTVYKDYRKKMIFVTVNIKIIFLYFYMLLHNNDEYVFKACIAKEDFKD